MLVIRLQRQGKTHFATYRIVVQDSRRHPSSGKVAAQIGSYNPHSKEVTVNAELAQKYLDNGAQPTTRVAKILKDNGVKLPSWVEEFDAKGAKKIRNAEKLRKNQPKEEKVEEVAETPAEEVVEETPATEETAEATETAEESTVEEKPAE
ncbi:30S ribosomal protein S16 [Candidatus Saccharibacteria bacterium]|nr:30S ribosomal protein S16 [Candidatus Saccharibacteria bacterium]